MVTAFCSNPLCQKLASAIAHSRYRFQTHPSAPPVS